MFAHVTPHTSTLRQELIENDAHKQPAIDSNKAVGKIISSEHLTRRITGQPVRTHPNYDFLSGAGFLGSRFEPIQIKICFPLGSSWAAGGNPSK